MRQGIVTALAAGAMITALTGLPAAAHGWGGVNLDFGFAPFAYGPPAYYAPPPVYYPPPPVVYAAPPPPGYFAPYPGYIQQLPVQAPPPATQSDADGQAQSCDAGAYVCPLDVSIPVGGRCYCPGNAGQRVYGAAQ